MKFLSSSRNKIIILLAAIAALQVLYLDAYLFKKEREHIKHSVYQNVKNISVNLQSSIEFLIRNDHEDQVKVEITELGINAAIKYALFTDQEQKVFASIQLANIGKSLWDIPLSFNKDDIIQFKTAIKQSAKSSGGKIWTTEDNKYVVSVYPVAAFLKSKGVRLPKTGSLIIIYDLSESINETYGMLLRLILLQMISLALLGLLLHFIVFNRISIIRKESEKISKGDYKVNIPLSGEDELSLLARNIETMAAEVSNLLDTIYRSGETFTKAQEIAHIGSWDWDISSGNLVWSDEIYRIFGLAPQEFGATYEAFIKSIHPEDVEKVTAAVNAAVSDSNIKYSVEHRVVQPDGRLRYVQEQGEVYRNEKTEPIRMIGTVLDITERKLIDRALVDERNFINAVLESAGALVIVLNKEGRIVRFNNACEKISGYQFDEVKNKFPWDTVLPKEDAEEIYTEAFKSFINQPGNAVGFYTNYWVNKNGEHILIDWTNNLLSDQEGNVEFIVSTGIDITVKQKALAELTEYRDKLEDLVEIRTSELNNAQGELIRKERLATLGQLTATVSHELRNPLGAMSPSLYVIQKMSDPEDERLQQAISRIGRNIERCDRIINELLDFTRIDSVTLVKTEIDRWLMSVLEEQEVPLGISLRTNLTLDNIQVNIDLNVLRRAVINVYENACQSMQDESDGNKVFPNSVLSITTEQLKDKIKIIFTDTGCGMSDDVLHKIFEPLFSTKGFGVGLGMSVVRQIMQQHKGDIEVESKVNVGTVISLWLPVVS